MTSSARLLGIAQRLQSIAQAGITYQNTFYDLERYQEIRALSARLLEEISDEPYEKIVPLFAAETGYQTPKVDVRAVLFRGKDEILLVREKSDGDRWTVPGGWADVGTTPFEAAAKEAKEETGLLVKPLRLLALLDKSRHGHPLQPWYVYKAFILCRELGGTLLQDTSETSGAHWFKRQELPSLPLSLDRITLHQLDLLFAFLDNPDLPAMCD